VRGVDSLNYDKQTDNRFGALQVIASRTELIQDPTARFDRRLGPPREHATLVRPLVSHEYNNPLASR